MMSESDSDLQSKELEWEKRVAVMRDRVKTRLDENTVEGKREEILFHGMKLVSSATMLGKLNEICYCEETQVSFAPTKGKTASPLPYV